MWEWDPPWGEGRLPLELIAIPGVLHAFVQHEEGAVHIVPMERVATGGAQIGHAHTRPTDEPGHTLVRVLRSSLVGRRAHVARRALRQGMKCALRGIRLLRSRRAHRGLVFHSRKIGGAWPGSPRSCPRRRR